MQPPYFAGGHPFPGDPEDLLDELVVAVTRDARGLGEARIHRWIGENPGQRVQLDDVGNSEAIHTHVDAAPIPAPQGTVGVQGDALRLDRKSTRLNSSHVEISYAVFCLKKKK